MKSLYILQHVHGVGDDEDVKMIGIYSSKENGEKAISELISQPGFKDCPKGFELEEYEVNETHWAEGYISCDEAMESSE